MKAFWEVFDAIWINVGSLLLVLWVLARLGGSPE